MAGNLASKALPFRVSSRSSSGGYRSTDATLETSQYEAMLPQEFACARKIDELQLRWVNPS